MIRGKKNFLNPSRLEMGFAILFKIDDSCVARHLNDRKPKYEDDSEHTIPIFEDTMVFDPNEKGDIISFDQPTKKQSSSIF